MLLVTCSASQLVIAGGRDTPRDASIFKWVVPQTEWFDLSELSGTWHVAANITTPRAGTMSVLDEEGRLIVLGGERDTQQERSCYSSYL